MNNKTNNIIKLKHMDRVGLAKKWSAIFGTSPPKAASYKFLLRSLAHEVQVKQNVGLSKSNVKALSAALAQHKNIGPSHLDTTPRIKLVPGSRLVREWNGKVYTVSVIEEGFVYKDKVWASLSAIARDITSAHWSGPRFFGVKGVV